MTIKSRLDKLEKNAPKAPTGDGAFELYKIALADAEDRALADTENRAPAGILANSSHPFAIAYREALVEIEQERIKDQADESQPTTIPKENQQ